MANILIIGAGPMGLASAWYALQAGHDVTIVEGAKEPGGMAAHFDFAGLSIERFYHFCCKGDQDTLDLLDELDLAGAMRWRDTTMGYFVDGSLYKFGDPVSLLKFDAITMIERLRYGFMAFISTKRSGWDDLDKISAREWITKWCGKNVYNKLWEPLLKYKFYEYTDTISAAWVWQRINRLGNSRKSLFTEQLGHIEGGSATLIDRLVEKIRQQGGKFVFGSPVETLVKSGSRTSGVTLVNGISLNADIVCSTIPLKHASAFLEKDFPELGDVYSDFTNVGCICVLHKLRQPVTPHFWVNVSDPDAGIPGFVEFSNLRPLPYSIVYVPYYMPSDRDEFSLSDSHFLNESYAILKRVNPDLSDSDWAGGMVSRLEYAQPVCDVGFSSRIPQTQTNVENLWIADTSFYYPEDRGLSESIRFAKQLMVEINAVADELADSAPEIKIAA